MNKFNDLQNEILNVLTDLDDDTNIGLTGERNLAIGKVKLIEKITSINPKYIKVLDCEAKILVRQGLFDVCLDAQNEPTFIIPDWNRFITAVNAFYEVCYK